MADNRLFLLDGHALVYRAHYAFIARPLINSKGQNTSAVAGFLRTLWDLIKSKHPTHLAVSFDTSVNTFRHEMYEPYKANREAQPEDITWAVPVIQEILKAFKIPVLMMDGYEADDVIGTIAKQAESEGYIVYMVTPDKDFSQLVSDKVFLYKPSRQGNGVEIMGVPEVLEKWGIQSVDQVVDMLGLQGDAVDNIPGIPGIGPKTASKLLEQFGSVEDLIANSDKLKGKQRENVEKFAEQGLLSKKLAKIDINAPIQFDENLFVLEPFDRERLSELFRELEFRTLAREILDDGKKEETIGDLFSNAELNSAAQNEKSVDPPAHSVATENLETTAHHYYLVQSEDKLKELVDKLASQSYFCFDTETTDIDPNVAELVGISFSYSPHEAYYVPIPKGQVEAKKVLEWFRPSLENTAILKVGQNLKYDMIILKWYGIELGGTLFDTMIAHYLLEPELRHNMDYMAETYLKYQPVSIETLIGKKGKNQLSMRDVPVEKVSDYAAEDADITLQLKDYLEPKLEAENLKELFQQIEIPLIRVLVDLEYNGVRIDSDFLQNYSVELEESVKALETSIYKEAGMEFNIASPKQVGDLLFGKMKIPYRWTKTKTGQFSTNEEKLAELAADHPFVEEILKHRGLTKLKSTYVDALPKLVNPKTGRIHSSFNQALAATGRLSSNNPNLQNIPIRTPEGRKIREAFIPKDENHVLLAADYSQIELRIIAEISKDEAMLEAFRSGQDIHKATAARVFDIPFDEVSKEQRYRAKTVNFSIIYGAGSTNLAQQLEISRAEAKELITQYFSQYKGLKTYMEDVVKGAREKGYVTTLLGRRRQLRDINSRNNMIRSNAERMAINTPIQGSAADMIKLAMINIHRRMQEEGLESKMIIQVHDELVFDALKEELDILKPIIEHEMKNAIPSLSVPILVEIGEGSNWLEAH